MHLFCFVEALHQRTTRSNQLCLVGRLSDRSKLHLSVADPAMPHMSITMHSNIRDPICYETKAPDIM